MEILLIIMFLQLDIIIYLMQNIMINPYTFQKFESLMEKTIKPVNPPILQDSSIDTREYQDNFKITNFNTLNLDKDNLIYGLNY